MDEDIFEECNDIIKPLKSAVLDEKTNKFIEEEDLINKRNKEKIELLKQGVRIAALKLDNYQANVKQFYKAQPFFYDKSKIFWFWNIEQNRWEIVDDTDIMVMLDERYSFQGLTVGASTKANYLEAFKRVGRQKIPKKSFNKWIQFKDKAYGITSKKIYYVTPDYFFTNPIPWEMGNVIDTPIMDKLFEEWVGLENIDVLYEVIAYCCYTDYPIQLIFCLIGSGRNGKSCFLRLLAKFLGQNNVCSTELDVLMDSRFEAFKLYKKLACFMGETNFGTMAKTSMLKKLVGGDLISYEKKNKDPFDDFNYAKLLISSNSLPSSYDTSEGFYRRWFIIDFSNEFPEGKDILKSIPDIEYNNLAKKVTLILPKLLESGKFTHQGNINERRDKYIMASNPLPVFLSACCIKEEDAYVGYNELFTAFVKFLHVHKKRRVKMKEFRSALEDEGFWIDRTTKGDDFSKKSSNWVIGLELKTDWKQKIYVNNVKKQEIPTQISI